ncbi:MAG: hypothetical protein ACMUEM_00460 [Flavobacteriales bacterium AspAUS03]
MDTLRLIIAGSVNDEKAFLSAASCTHPLYTIESDGYHQRLSSWQWTPRTATAQRSSSFQA